MLPAACGLQTDKACGSPVGGVRCKIATTVDPHGELLMDYLGSYRFVFRSRNWATNLLFATLCSLIPAIGPIVLMGYFFEIIEYLIRRRQGAKVLDSPPEAISEQLLDALPVDSAQH